MNLEELLFYAVESKASDLHLSAGLRPQIRVDGDLCPLNQPVLQHEELLKMLYNLMNNKQHKDYEEQHEIDFSFEISKLARFRVNVFKQARGAGAVFRILPPKIPQLTDLPAIFRELASYPKGLILVTGPTGSGKTTTLAAMIDYINEIYHKHILTIEDPLEYIHDSKNCLITQREIHRDTQSFNSALRAALREDPDVILIGELRDQESIRLAMTAAETGHLVLASLHTNSATKTINRIIEVFKGEERSVIRSLLSESLQAVVAQVLLKKTGGGRQLAFEVMICNTAIRHLIREDKINQMYSTIQTGQAQGMQTLDQHLVQLVQNNQISSAVAYEVAVNKTLF